jgi:uncharacterized SAM-binding protein YcdF (DUF218 family)
MPPPTDHQPAAAPLPGKLPGQPRRWWLRIACLLAVAGALLLTGWLFRVPLLAGLGRAWVVNEPAAHADAIVILGGGLENRPFAAARLFQQGVAPKILYMEVKLGPVQEMGALPSENEVTRLILLGKDVPASALVAIGTNVASTYDESRAVRAWIRQTGATSIIICTDLFHTRRARWIFRHELRDTPVKIYVVPVDPVDYNLENWWRNEEGLIQFQNELVKSVYYWFKY